MLSYFKNLSLIAKNTVLSAIVLLAVGTGFAVTLQSLALQSVYVSEIGKNTEVFTHEVIPLNNLVKEIKINTIQVQQWLTDISATRGLDGLNDGYDMAEKQASLFARNMDDAEKIARDIGIPEMISALEGVKKAFPPYYETGRKMAAAYIEGGPEKGNAIMAEFDETSQAIQDSMESLLKITGNIAQKSQENVEQKVGDMSMQNAYLKKVGIVSFACVVIVQLILIMVSHVMIGKPIASASNIMKRMTDGDYGIRIPVDDRVDEVGTMLASMQVFKENAQETERLRVAQKQQEEQMVADRRKMMADMANKFETDVGGVIRSVSDMAEEMQKSAHSMTKNASDTSDQATTVAAAAEQASSNVQSVATAAEELTASISEINSQASRSSKVAAEAKQKADGAAGKMGSLNAAAKRVGEVVTLINDIAEQTNLLALNATIEAARAGEMGKGFAVVASEVKNLATQTAKATEEIVGQITDMQKAAEESNISIAEIKRIIETIDEIATLVAAAVEQQGVTTREIARNVQEASAGTREVTTNISRVTAAAGETGASANSVLGVAEDMSLQATKLRGAVEAFLDSIKG